MEPTKPNMRTRQHPVEKKAAKISHGARHLKPRLLTTKTREIMADPRTTANTPVAYGPPSTYDGYDEDSSDDEKCRVLRIHKIEDPGVSSDEDLFASDDGMGTTAESPIDLTEEED